MPADVDAIASMVVLTIQKAIGPVLERQAALEQNNKDLHARVLELSGLRDRVVVVETKASTLGAKGLDGEPGVPGERGHEGPAGPPGRDGAPGEKGINGQPGAAGERGPEGPEGKPGRDGRDGLPGVPGLAGEKGLDGKPGAAGINGRDGTLENLKALYDGERTVTLCFKDGTAIEGGTIRFPVEIWRGVYADGRTYEQCDSVTWGGSEWHANETTTTKPGDGSKAWTLKVKRGRDGKDGRDGHDAALPVVSVGRSS